MVKRFHQGEIWWARLDAPIGTRPVLLISRETAYRVRTEFLAAIVTTTVYGIPTEVALGAAEGLSKPCVANLDVLLTIPRDRLVRRGGRVGPKRMHEVFDALRFAVGMPS